MKVQLPSLLGLARAMGRAPVTDVPLFCILFPPGERRPAPTAADAASLQFPPRNGFVKFRPIVPLVLPPGVHIGVSRRRQYVSRLSAQPDAGTPPPGDATVYFRKVGCTFASRPDAGGRPLKPGLVFSVDEVRKLLKQVTAPSVWACLVRGEGALPIGRQFFFFLRIKKLLVAARHRGIVIFISRRQRKNVNDTIAD